jgi:hypothetical protein
MSRRQIAVGFAALAWAVSIAAAIFAACSCPSCKPNTLALQLALVDGAPLADTFTVSDDDPGAVVSESFAHAPNLTSPGENFDIAVTWPNGYPAHAAVHLTVRAFAAGVLIGSNTGTVVLDATCTSSEMLLGTENGAADGGTTD